MELSLRIGRWHLTIDLHHDPEPRWETVQMEDGAVHVHPLGDAVVHTLTDDCACGPTPEQGQSACMYVHHSLDGREQHE